jgi:hypothetical protein
MLSVAITATYDDVRQIILLFFSWVTLPRAPHFLNCAETNGGKIKEKMCTESL